QFFSISLFSLSFPLFLAISAPKEPLRRRKRVHLQSDVALDKGSLLLSLNTTNSGSVESVIKENLFTPYTRANKLLNKPNKEEFARVQRVVLLLKRK
ncbi:MAG: hypothetical protein OIF58_07205, partial [Cohaesibacter sp.]|nr:hypothetical protein [Cohaesibacter sp.]